MSQSFDTERWREAVVLLLVIAVFLLASPFLRWWATAERPWYLVYLVWGGIVLLIYLLQRRNPHDL